MRHKQQSDRLVIKNKEKIFDLHNFKYLKFSILSQHFFIHTKNFCQKITTIIRKKFKPESLKQINSMSYKITEVI